MRGNAVRGALVSLVGAATLLFAGNALALSGKTLNVGTPFDVGQLATAVDPTGTGYIVWSNTKDLPPTTVNVVQYCVIPPGATVCSHSGTLTPADGAQYIDNVQVLVDGSTVVILADVYGAQGNMARDYEPEQEWQSPLGGASFNIVNGGLSVTDGIIDADTEPLSAVIVPGTGVLGYGWDTAGGPPTFNAFPLSSPPECSTAMCPYHYATLEPNTNPDQVSNAGGQYASELSPNPGVLAIFNTLFSNGPLGCTGTSTFGTAFAYGSGAESSTNDYNISPGSPDSAWKVPVARADCSVEYPAVAGGPSGLGVVEDNLATGHTVYHAFDQTHQNFDTPQATILNDGELDAAVSQDGGGGIYATYLGGGSGGPIALSYSAGKEVGTDWTTGLLNTNSDGGAGSLTSSVSSGGQGWAAWVDNGSVFVQQFVARDAVAAVAGGRGSSNGQSIATTIDCSVTPCTVTVTITGDPTVRRKPKIIRIASGTFTLRHSGLDKIAVRLTNAGKSLLAAHHGRLKATLVIVDKSLFGVKTTRTLNITTKKT